MPERKTIPLPIGGMATAGDPAARQNTVPKVKNCFLRPGPRLEKRGGWLKDTLVTVPYGMLMALEDNTGDTTLYHDSASTNGTAVRNTDGTWTAITGATESALDYVCHDDVLFVVETFASGGGAWSRSGATLDLSPFVATICGQSITHFAGRMFVGATTARSVECGNASLTGEYEGGGDWTAGGGPPTIAVSGDKRQVTIVNGATDTLKTSAAIRTTTAADEVVTWVQPVQNLNDEDIPLTLTIENSGGTVVYGSREVIAPGVQTTGSDAGWTILTVSAQIPAASTDLYLKILVGNVSSGAATNGLVFSVSELGAGGGYEPQLMAGRFIDASAGTYTSSGSVVQSPEEPFRIRWSQADNFEDWRYDGSYDCTTTPGAITVLRSGDSKLYAFKSNSITVFRSGPTDEIPIVEEQALRDVGCIGPKCIDSLEGAWVFADKNNIYRWDGAGNLEALAGEGIREEIYETTPSVVAVDRDKREVYVVSGTRIFVYSIDMKGWTYLTVTGANDSELAISDLWYGKPTGESAREMWALVTDGAAAKQIVKLRSSQTQDNVDGTSRDVVAEVIFAPLEAQQPRQAITVQRVNLKHKISGSQSASTTAVGDSYNGGSTWPDEVTVRISPLSTGADSDYKTMPVPIQHTAPRHTLRVVHTGLAGASYFNLTMAEADVLVRGREVPAANPTAVSSTL